MFVQREEHLDFFRCDDKNVHFLTQVLFPQITALQPSTWKSIARTNIALQLKIYSDIDFVFIKQRRGDLIGCFRDSQTLPSQFVFIDRTRQSYTESLKNSVLQFIF